MWHKNLFTLENYSISKSFLIIKGNWGEKKYLVNVYSTCVYNEKKKIWKEIMKCRRSDNNKLWCRNEKG